VRRFLWPWLKQRGYADAADDEALEQFLGVLGKRPAHMRPGLRLKRRWDSDAIGRLGGRHELALSIRRDVNAILRAGDEPQLPASGE
jgi:hypothetical protein